MSVLYLVVPAALALVGAAIVAFVWASQAGQFDDLITPAIRALHDDLAARKSSTPTNRRPAPEPEPPAAFD